VRAQSEADVEGQLVPSGAGRDAVDGGGERGLVRAAHVDGRGPERETGGAASRWRGQSDRTSGGEHGAIVVDVDVDDVLVADEPGDRRVGRARHEVVGRRDLAELT
jgi:hypothetical protein